MAKFTVSIGVSTRVYGFPIVAVIQSPIEYSFMDVRLDLDTKCQAEMQKGVLVDESETL